MYREVTESPRVPFTQVDRMRPAYITGALLSSLRFSLAHSYELAPDSIGFHWFSTRVLLRIPSREVLVKPTCLLSLLLVCERFSSFPVFHDLDNFEESKFLNCLSFVI